MNRIPSRTRFVALALAALPLGACSAGSSPDALAGKLQAALGKGDFKAARALANLDDAPADVHFFYLDMVRECGSEATCAVKAEATSAEACSSIRENAAKIALKADGCLVITSMARDGSGSGTMKLPFVNRDGDYKVATIGYSAEELAALRAKTSETLLNELFSKGPARQRQRRAAHRLGHGFEPSTRGWWRAGQGLRCTDQGHGGGDRRR